MHKVLVNRCLPRKCVVRLTNYPDMTLTVYRGRTTTKQQSASVINASLGIWQTLMHVKTIIIPVMALFDSCAPAGNT